MNKARLGFTIMGILFLLSWLSNTVSFLYENYPTLTISVIGVVVVLVPVILLMRAQRDVEEELRKQLEEALRRKRLERVL
jgi:uncharacterized membrane protein